MELRPAWEVGDSGMEQRSLPRCANVASMVCMCVCVCVCVCVCACERACECILIGSVRVSCSVCVGIKGHSTHTRASLPYMLIQKMLFICVQS